MNLGWRINDRGKQTVKHNENKDVHGIGRKVITLPTDWRTDRHTLLFLFYSSIWFQFGLFYLVIDLLRRNCHEKNYPIKKKIGLSNNKWNQKIPVFPWSLHIRGDFIACAWVQDPYSCRKGKLWSTVGKVWLTYCKIENFKFQQYPLKFRIVRSREIMISRW